MFIQRGLAGALLMALGQQVPPARGPRLPAPAPPVLATQRPPTRADLLRGEYGRYRANNDLLYYHLDVRVDPERKSIAGQNTIRFRMLKDDTRIQLDLYANLNVDKILLGTDAAQVRAGRSTPSSSTFRRR